MKVFKKTRRPERTESTGLPVETPRSTTWGWLELGCALTLASAVLVSLFQVLLVAAGNIVE
jgi:hypothetical protein